VNPTWASEGQPVHTEDIEGHRKRLIYQTGIGSLVEFRIGNSQKVTVDSRSFPTNEKIEGIDDL
jgi:hypothetical protein